MRTLTQHVHFKANPETVYATLMDSKKHGALTNTKATIDAKVGGSFTSFDEWADGKNLELVPGKKIVQLWRAHTDNWPEDHYSTITYALTSDGKGGTDLTFTQEQLPDACYDDIAQGWHEYYWEPLAKIS